MDLSISAGGTESYTHSQRGLSNSRQPWVGRRSARPGINPFSVSQERAMQCLSGAVRRKMLTVLCRHVSENADS